MAILNTGAFPKHLDGDINKIYTNTLVAYEREYPAIAQVANAPAGGHYTEAELSGLGHLETKHQGQSINFDIPVEGNEKSITYVSYAKGFQITEEGIQDDLFGNFKKLPESLARSAAIKPDIVFFNTIFNNGFGTTTSWDGDYIFDTDHHKLYLGTTATGNEPATPSDLTETSLQEAFEYGWNATDHAGMPVYLDPEIVLVAVANTWQVNKLWKDSGQIGSANNDSNTVAPTNGIISWRPFISRFLTDADAWFLLFKQRDCRLWWKKQATLESMDDFYTGNAMWKATERFAAFTMDWQGMWGNPGA